MEISRTLKGRLIIIISIGIINLWIIKLVGVIREQQAYTHSQDILLKPYG